MTTMKKMKDTSYSYDDQILCEILSRLPLKSLERFKCVSKPWQFLIEKDQWLIDLHHSQQMKTNLRLLMMLLPRDNKLRALVKFESYWTANLCLDTHKEITKTTTVQEAISNKDLLACKQVLKPINGMICLIDKVERNDRPGLEKFNEDHAASLYNIITQESTPWIRSTYLAQVEQWCDLPKVNVSRTYDFGFDPATEEYKVICIWRISGWLLQYFEGCGEYTILDEHSPVYEACYRMCEILTLGKDTAWRRIDKVPPSDYCKAKKCSVYVNGIVYWTHYENFVLTLVAFDVGREEYRVISDLDFISHHKSDLDFISSRESFYLLELDGRLAIEENTGNHKVNLWMLDDDCDKNSSTRNTSSIRWTKEMITLPIDWSYQKIRFHAVARTENLILECYVGYYEPPVWVHCYNRKNKIFSRIRITGDGNPVSMLGAYIGHPFHMFTTYVESLLTLQRSHRPAMKAPDTSSTKTF